MSRGNGKMCIFLDDDDYRQFVNVLGDVVEECRIECWNYCVMPNHYHLTLQPSAENLSAAVQRLNSVYAQWWNWRHKRVGHVFQGRFKDQIVQQEGYLLALTRYVAMNPVRAGLVVSPDAWPWSSYRATVGLGTPPSFLAVASTLRLFGNEDQRMLQERFAEHVTSIPEDHGTVQRIRSRELILGDRAFKKLVSLHVAGEAEDQESVAAPDSGSVSAGAVLSRFTAV
jgi:REP element-mobilizing transposase RayT